MINGDLKIPGCRLNPKIVAESDSLLPDPSNKLRSQLEESSLRLSQLKQMQLTGELGSQSRFGSRSVKESDQENIRDNHEKCSYREFLTLNDKEVSFDLVYTMLGKRFHECLRDSSKNPQDFARVGD